MLLARLVCVGWKAANESERVSRAWKDGFVIEYVGGSKRISCSKCLHYISEDKSCIATRFIVTQNGYNYWRHCPKFESNPFFDTPDNKKAEIIHHYWHKPITVEERERRLAGISIGSDDETDDPGKKTRKSSRRKRSSPVKRRLETGDTIMHPAHGEGRICFMKDDCVQVHFRSGLMLSFLREET